LAITCIHINTISLFNGFEILSFISSPHNIHLEHPFAFKINTLHVCTFNDSIRSEIVVILVSWVYKSSCIDKKLSIQKMQRNETSSYIRRSKCIQKRIHMFVYIMK